MLVINHSLINTKCITVFIEKKYPTGKKFYKKGKNEWTYIVCVVVEKGGAVW